MLRFASLLAFGLVSWVISCAGAFSADSNSHAPVGSALASPSPPPSPPPLGTLLITAFDPFDGAKENTSTAVALQIQTLLHRWKANICILHTIYDQASEEALACLRELKTLPIAVVSLGEADCRLRLERRAENLDNDPSTPDNSGATRIATAIIPGAPLWLPTDLPVDQMMKSLSPAERGAVYFSESAGNFVCNNTFYRLRWELKDTGLRSGFIHVPKHTCAKPDIQGTAQTITHMLESSL